MIVTEKDREIRNWINKNKDKHKWVTHTMLDLYAKHYHQQQVKALSINDVSVSFNDSEKDEFIETTIFLNSQNLSGRETEDELYKQGIIDCFDDLIDKINER